MERHALKPGHVTNLAVWIVILFLVLPITVVIPVSFTDQRYLSLPQETWSTSHYAELFRSSEWLSSIAQSFVIAMASTVTATLLGTICAIGTWRIAPTAAGIFRALVLLPLVVPSIVYALGVFRFFAEWGLLDSYTGVVLAHTVTAIPYVFITVSAALSGFDPRIEQAARGLGAGHRYTLIKVVLPNITPGIVSGAIFAFIHSWDELVIVLFIASRRIFTLPRRIWDGINEHLDPVMAAVATCLIVLTVALVFAESRVRRSRIST